MPPFLSPINHSKKHQLSTRKKIYRKCKIRSPNIALVPMIVSTHPHPKKTFLETLMRNPKNPNFFLLFFPGKEIQRTRKKGLDDTYKHGFFYLWDFTFFKSRGLGVLKVSRGLSTRIRDVINGLIRTSYGGAAHSSSLNPEKKILQNFLNKHIK